MIGCQVLEDEIAYVLANDPEVRRILVVSSPQAEGIATKLRRAGGVEVVEVNPEEMAGHLPEEGTAAIVWVKPIALHQDPSQLRREVMDNARLIAPLCRSILVFYGLCGNAFRAIDSLSKELSVPLVILRDAKGMIADDCVGAVLGGTEEYRSFLMRDKGGYTMNTMWAANWRHFMVETQFLRDPADPEEARIVFQCMDYHRVVMLDTGLGDKEAFQRQVEEFASVFGLGRSEERCTLSVVESSYRLAKSLMRASVREPALTSPSP